MTIGLDAAIRSAQVQAILDALDAGSGAALIRIYDGSRPSTGGTATTLLAELTCSDPSGSVTTGVLTFDTITQDSSANASGTATWFRMVDSSGTFVMDGSVGTSGADMNLVTTTIVAGQPVSLSSGTITAGNA